VAQLLRLDPEAKCIVTSGYSTSDVLANYKKFGFKAAIKKPFQVEEIVSVLGRSDWN